MSQNNSKPKPYPTQPTAPVMQQQAYPQMQQPYGQPYMQSAGYGQPMPGMPPPPPNYNQAMSHPIAPNNYTQPQWTGQHQQVGGAPYYGYPQQGYAGQAPYYGQPQPQYVVQQAPVAPVTVVAPGAFDAGARFNSTSQVRIPPPPPGIAPNMAQIASANGQTVQASQRPDNFLTGGSNGGMVFW